MNLFLCIIAYIIPLLFVKFFIRYENLHGFSVLRRPKLP